MLIVALWTTKVPSGPAHNRLFVVVLTSLKWTFGDELTKLTPQRFWTKFIGTERKKRQKQRKNDGLD
jgi:hypothetical protein